MDLINCPDCGLQQEIDSRFCIGCGKPINTPVSEPTEEEPLPPLVFPEEKPAETEDS